MRRFPNVRALKRKAKAGFDNYKAAHSGPLDSVASSVMNRCLRIGREGGIACRSAQQVEGHLESLIV
jgi:hypothetical protein